MLIFLNFRIEYTHKHIHKIQSKQEANSNFNTYITVFSVPLSFPNTSD